SPEPEETSDPPTFRHDALVQQMTSDKTLLLKTAHDGSSDLLVRRAVMVSFLDSKIMRLAAMRHADIEFKHLWPRQPAQALPDLREAGLVRIYARRRTHLDMYARERWGAQDQFPRRRGLHS